MSGTYYKFSESFGAIAAAFVHDSLAAMIPWLFAMGAIVLLDLISGIGKCLKLRYKIAISKFCRDSIAKFTTYFGFVVAACMIQTAAELDFGLAKWCCLSVMTIEGVSIFGNIFKMKGYDLNFNKVIEILVSKRFGIDSDTLDGLLTESKDTNKKNQK